MGSITVLSFYDRIAAFYTLSPFLKRDYEKEFTFTKDPNWCLKHDSNRILIMIRQFLKPDITDFDFLKKARRKYDRIAFFNGNAGGGIPRLDVLPFVDLFYNKALFKNRLLYKKPLYGGELYSDHYHQKWGIADAEDKERRVVTEDHQLEKLRLSWNIGIGEFPRRKYRQRAGVLSARLFGMRSSFLFRSGKEYSWPVSQEKSIDVHARLVDPPKKSIAWQRVLLRKQMGDHPAFLQGHTSQHQYNREIGSSKITLSPFGWGEVCFRDFEAVLGRSLLLKPDMSHLETWPDIYKGGTTYIPLKWDGSDLSEKAEYYLEHEKERIEICGRAITNYADQRKNLGARFETILDEIKG